MEFQVGALFPISKYSRCHLCSFELFCPARLEVTGPLCQTRTLSAARLPLGIIQRKNIKTGAPGFGSGLTEIFFSIQPSLLWLFCFTVPRIKNDVDDNFRNCLGLGRFYWYSHLFKGNQKHRASSQEHCSKAESSGPAEIV